MSIVSGALPGKSPSDGCADMTILFKTAFSGIDLGPLKVRADTILGEVVPSLKLLLGSSQRTRLSLMHDLVCFDKARLCYLFLKYMLPRSKYIVCLGFSFLSSYVDLRKINHFHSKFRTRMLLFPQLAMATSTACARPKHQ